LHQSVFEQLVCPLLTVTYTLTQRTLYMCYHNSQDNIHSTYRDCGVC